MAYAYQFQPGNTHGVFGGAWDKPYLQALRMELARGGKNHQLLRRIAAKHLAMCEEGNPWAIKELIERLDGKVPQEQRVFSQSVTVELSDQDIQRRLLELQATDVTPGKERNKVQHAPEQSKEINSLQE